MIVNHYQTLLFFKSNHSSGSSLGSPHNLSHRHRHGVDPRGGFNVNKVVG